MPKWTPQQAKAIDERKANILVSAAAGSGKTAVLVERILRLILEERVQLTEMLIVTFTNAAAGEMRERIMGALLAKMKEDPENADFIRQQLGLVNRAPIKTLHAFCMDVLRQNFHQLDLDPAFRIGDMSELMVLKQQVMDGFIESLYEEADPAFIQLVECYSGNRSDERLQQMIYKLHSFLMSKPNPRVWLDAMVGLYDLEADQLHHHIWVKTLLQDAKDGLDAASSIIQEAILLCQLDEGPAAYTSALESDMIMIHELMEAIDGDFGHFLEKVSGIAYERLKTIPKKEKELLSEGLIDEVKQKRDHMKKDMIEPIKKAFGNFTASSMIEQAQQMKPLIACLGKLALELDRRFIEAKRDRDMLDFNDLEHLTIELFENEEIADYYRKQFKYIFIDEYQDSNIVQETIIGAIKREDNLFMVGDVKQSIYKFRLADPSIFTEKYERYPHVKEGHDLRIDLNRNFRSRPEILEGINVLFEQLMSKSFGEIAYDDAAALYPGMAFESHKDPILHVKVLDVDPPEIELDEEWADTSQAEAEARAIAAQIKELLKGIVFDPRKGEFRQPTYRDMVILLRATRSWAPIFQDVFEEEGIPLFAESNTGYFDTIEIRILMDFLRVIDNKQQDIPLLSVLRSPIFGFKTENLVEVRMAHPKLSFYSALKRYAEETESELAVQINQAFRTIEGYVSRAQYQRLNELIWDILVETRYYYYVGALPGGDVRQGNLKMLVNHADEFERTSLTGLFSFIQYLELVTRSSGDMGEARTLNANDNVLRLMSIHKSKGLEFPVVFVAGLGKQFNQQDLRNDLILHKDLGLTLRYVDAEQRIFSDSLGILASKKIIRLENLAEEMRILYVAMTRAVDQLYLYGTVKNLDKNQEKWNRGNSVFFLKKAMNYLGWLMPILGHGRDEGLLGAWTLETQTIHQVMERKIEQMMADEFLQEALLKDADSHLTESFEKIHESFNWQYPYRSSRLMPPKVSVTELNRLKGAKELLTLPDFVEAPKFVGPESTMEGSDFGTLIHAYMEHVKLEPVMDEAYLTMERNRLVEAKILSQGDAQIIRIPKILLFFESHVGNRMRKSQRVKREQPFVLAMNVADYIEGASNDVIVQGIIDCYFEEDDGLVILDYKTDSTREQTPESIGAKYRSQLELYSKALEKGTGRPVKEAHLYLFSSDESIRVL